VDATVAFIRAYQGGHGGMPPTVNEVREALGLKSSSTVMRFLQFGVELGMLEKLEGQGAVMVRRYRAKVLPGEPCPMCGYVQW